MRGLSVSIHQSVSPGFTLQVDFEARADGVTALFGPSGSGKTSVLDTIAGLRGDDGGGSVSARKCAFRPGRDREPPLRKQWGLFLWYKEVFE